MNFFSCSTSLNDNPILGIESSNGGLPTTVPQPKNNKKN